VRPRPPEGVGFTCTICGRHHDEELRDVRAGLPEEIHRLPEEERKRRALLSPAGDFAALDDDRHFVRALIQVPIDDGGVFGWGVWARLELEELEAVVRSWFDDASAGAGHRAWLATQLPAYGQTEGLPGTLRLRSADLLPLFELDADSSPLANEQRVGIDVQRARELAEPYRQA
jgi:hypothetical protein